MVLRAILAFAVLITGSYAAVVAGVSETCTGNSADSLYAFVVTLPCNLVGMALLGWKSNRIAVIIVATLPAFIAVMYTQIAISLISGVPACTITTGLSAWEPSGDETTLAIGWAASALVFWIGLAYALSGGYRPRHDRDAEHFA